MFVIEKAPGEVHPSSRENDGPVLDDVSKLLLKAAALIEERGWCTHLLSDDRGRMCLRGGLIAAAGHKPWGLHDRSGIGWCNLVNGEVPNGAAIIEADARVEKVVGEHPATWNNEKAGSAAAVVAKLRAVALGG